eukprot:3692720-Prymnesium_polylepis.2
MPVSMHVPSVDTDPYPAVRPACFSRAAFAVRGTPLYERVRGRYGWFRVRDGALSCAVGPSRWAASCRGGGNAWSKCNSSAHGPLHCDVLDTTSHRARRASQRAHRALAMLITLTTTAGWEAAQ